VDARLRKLYDAGALDVRVNERAERGALAPLARLSPSTTSLRRSLMLGGIYVSCLLKCPGKRGGNLNTEVKMVWI
jgi:hypothetical protein